MVTLVKFNNTPGEIFLGCFFVPLRYATRLYLRVACCVGVRLWSSGCVVGRSPSLRSVGRQCARRHTRRPLPAVPLHTPEVFTPARASAAGRVRGGPPAEPHHFT